MSLNFCLLLKERNRIGDSLSLNVLKLTWEYRGLCVSTQEIQRYTLEANPLKVSCKFFITFLRVCSS